MPNNIKLLKWSELFSKSLPTDKSVAILTEGDVSAQDRTDVIEALNLDQTDVSFSFVEIEDNYTATRDNTYIICGNGQGPYTVYLPPANVKQILYIKSLTVDRVTIAATGANIDGDADYDLEFNDVIKLVSTGENEWYVFSKYVAPV